MLQTYADIHKYSVTELSNFWEDVWNLVGMIYEGEYTHVVDEHARMDSLPEWFPGVKLNYVDMVCLHYPAGGFPARKLTFSPL